MMDVKLTLISTVTGALVGAIFGVLKLPIPAPSTFSGISAIFGIYFGFQLVTYFMGKWF